MTAISETQSAGFSHPALFYRDEQSYLAGTVPFVLEGLDRDEPVAVAVPEPNLRRIEAALGDAAGAVRLIDMSEAGRNPGRIIAGVLRAFADQHDGHVRIIGEPIWPGRTEQEYPACVQHEALINESFAGWDGAILCPYDAGRLDAAVLADAEATHPVLLDGDGPRRSTRYAPYDVLARCNTLLEAPPAVETMRFDATTLSRARHFAVDRAAAHGVSDDRLDELALVVGELCGNSVLHGGGSGTLRTWRDDEAVVCEVSDAGHLTDPLAGRRPAHPTQQGGRGLLLVHHLADLVRTHTSPAGTTTRAFFRLR
ncbi:sensor histidine kinase [Prauserella muralis]|uniref:Anti-sigma regulatory factor n=1 Tax=Prauserella muralis TaxID=588067 RepID=A0A2V4AZX4_9PSEU|nr:sensor histidine kinase [Prauserella muralis]PXY27494.1 anti-sigma regulatory factor [Prauserella muralis]TWE22792.1 anti-sigma regulatory factor (Ser/Thr protein kinase) [Prauserella muralis]